MMTTLPDGRRAASRALIRIVTLGAALLAAACSNPPAAPVAPAASASPARAGKSAKLTPAGQSRTGRSGYMLSSGLDDDQGENER